MIIVAGTIPLEHFPLVHGPVALEDGMLHVEGQGFPCGMGSGAMISALIETLEYFGLENPVLVAAGDIGDAEGSRNIYRKLEEVIPADGPSMVVMHYLQPLVTPMRSLCTAVQSMENKPVMVADAGSLYAAKAAGRAGDFTLLTPDEAEMKFLADDQAMHPAYVSNYFLQSGNESVPELIKKAYDDGNSSEYVLVKGKTDYIAVKGDVVATTNSPDVPILEPIGGTGDTITGIVAGLIAQGFPVDQAAHHATVINRKAGERTNLRPDTRVLELIKNIKFVLKETPFH